MKYAELKAENEKLKRDLQLAQMIIQNAHDELDKLGAPNAELGAHPGHRVFWYMQEKEKARSYIDRELLKEFPDLAKEKEWLDKAIELEDKAGGFPDRSGQLARLPESYIHKLPIVKE